MSTVMAGSLKGSMSPCSPCSPEVTENGESEKVSSVFLSAVFQNASVWKPERDVVTTTDLGNSGRGGSICGHVYSPVLQNEKRTASWLLGARRVVSHGSRAAAASSGLAREARRSRATRRATGGRCCRAARRAGSSGSAGIIINIACPTTAANRAADAIRIR